MELSTLKPNPFLNRQKKPPVYVEKGSDPYQNTIKVLSQFDLSVAQGKKVLLKPNVGRLAEIGSGIVTNPQVVAATIDAFRNAGANVAIGESPISGVNTMEAFETCGMKKIADDRNCPLIDMDDRRYKDFELPNGVAIKKLRICPELFEFDLVVSIPVIKTHMHTGVTLSIKNMKGALWRRSKVQLHMLDPVPGIDEKPINIAIADMAWALRPHLAIIDGSIGMEGLGPSAGKPKTANLLLAGADAFATDAVACALMGLDAQDVPHLQIGGERNYGSLNLDDIDINPGNWRDFIVPFDVPPSGLDFEFPGFDVLDENSCSACQSTLLLFLKHYGEQILDYFPENEKMRIAIGKGHENLPNGTLCLGNCVTKHRDSGIFVSGCPPVSSEILRAITGKPVFDTRDGGEKS